MRMLFSELFNHTHFHLPNLTLLAHHPRRSRMERTNSTGTPRLPSTSTSIMRNGPSAQATSTHPSVREMLSTCPGIARKGPTAPPTHSAPDDQPSVVQKRERSGKRFGGCVHKSDYFKNRPGPHYPAIFRSARETTQRIRGNL